jgi:type I restriction enzyme M protein
MTNERRTPKNSELGPSSNKFCRSEDLTNEAAVEQFFVNRLLSDLGYEDKEIKPKTAIAALAIGKGRRKEPWKPDYMVVCRRKPRWIIDAKAPGENPDKYVDQGGGYCFAVNQKTEDNPVHYFLLTNGFLTRVYPWDKAEPVLSLRFADFVEGNTKFTSLRKLLCATAARSGWSDQKRPATGHAITRPTMEEAKKAFSRCHRIIWKADKVGRQGAFDRFAKILFVKLWEDRKLRDNADHLAAIGRGDPLPADAVRFSTRWIEQQEGNSDNPIDRILFRDLVDALEKEIQAKKRKRIFDPNERLNVSPGTVKRVVAELEHCYLFGIDEDLNGRMFEAFLVASMRGEDLGQYFTPRSIVKLLVRIGRPLATPSKIEKCLDGCCGTGGFLIELLTEMRRQIYENKALTGVLRTELLQEVANEAIFGIDAGQDPPLVKIARINMYLHGDGGSRVYMTDALRKIPTPSGGDTPEATQEVLELRDLLAGSHNQGPLHFDLVLTNPPFSMDYSSGSPDEWEVLKDYELRMWGDKERTSLRSAVMFIERYYDLLQPGGRLLTVIDDGVLGGKKMSFVRDYLRSRFLINGIISLHGDAFQRAGARVKTSILCLTKKRDEDEQQPDAFVYETRYVGLDDVPSRTPPSVAEEARRMALAEIEEVAGKYDQYLNGLRGPWVVPADRLGGRLDAKNLNPWSVSALESSWLEAGARTAVLGDLVESVTDEVAIAPASKYTFLRISYEGYAEDGEQRLGREISYSWVGRARPNDIIVSNISAVYRAICVLPDDKQELLITPEFTVLRVKAGSTDIDAMYLWSVLRSPAVIAEWLAHSTGVGRHRVTWDLLKQQRVPLLKESKQKEIGDLYREALELELKSRRTMILATSKLAGLVLDGELAKDQLARAKPPR